MSLRLAGLVQFLLAALFGYCCCLFMILEYLPPAGTAQLASFPKTLAVADPTALRRTTQWQDDKQKQQSQEEEQKQQQSQEEEPFVNDLLKRLNYKTSVNDIRNGAGLHDLFDPDREAILFGQQQQQRRRTHPTRRIVIDVGPYNGMDIALPAYQRGYTVVSFELNPRQVQTILANWKREGLVQDQDFFVIDGPFPLKERPIVGKVEENDKPKLYLVRAGASNCTQQVVMEGSDVTGHVATTTTTTNKKRGGAGGNTWVTRIDEVVDWDANILFLKTDAEGHDGQALLGASNLLPNVYTIQLEFRPAAFRTQGTDPVALLRWLWEMGFQCFDMNTHPGYVSNLLDHTKNGLGRPSKIADFVAWLEHIPKGPGPSGANTGGWEDLICSQRRIS